MSLLYEAESRSCQPLDSVLDGLVVEPDAFVVDLVRGTCAHLAEVDDLIGHHARGWSLERMPVVDRSLLRLATYELVHRADVPVGAVISEAVELAKQFSTDDSGRFVNGVLGQIASVVRGTAAPPAGQPGAATVTP